jgi:serine O-acetyltransferase
VFKVLREDIQTVFAKDPAARSTLEVLTCYPGLHALWLHRIAHYLWHHGFRLPARLLSHFGRFLTSIEIHPGAVIGRRFFIDHGAGVVIGETSEIGDEVLIYQGFFNDTATTEKKKRHPTVGNNVVIGAGAIALGPITIGDDARVGSGSVVIKSVPPGVTVVGVPGRSVEDSHRPIPELEHGKLPDPIAQAISLVLREQDELEARLSRLEKQSGIRVSSDELEEKRKRMEQELEEKEE